MKILFLDIDSVLNFSSEACSTVYDEPKDSSKLVEPAVPVCKSCYCALKHIYSNVPGLKTVWSTDWRLVEDSVWNGWKNPLKWLESQEWIKQTVIGKTPKKMSSTRPEEIHLWLRCNEHNKKLAQHEWMSNPCFDVWSFAVLDDWDSPLMDKFGRRMFKTTWASGLTADIADGVIECLNTVDYDVSELDQMLSSHKH